MNKLQKMTIGAIVSAVVLSFVPAAFAIGSNGSFENGSVIGAGVEISAGDSTTITGWTVESGSIGYVGTYWQAADGVRSIDLVGLGSGAISQDIPTVSGHTYKVSFAMAGNPDGLPAIKTLDAKINNVITAGFSFDITGKTLTNMGWTPKSFEFTATGATTKLTFANTTQSDTYGPAIDTVLVEDITVEATPTVTPTVTTAPTTTPTAVPTAVPTATATVTPVPQDPNIPAECQGMTFDKVIKGSDGSDKLYGTKHRDLIFGYGGSDTIYGKGGADCIVGGDGSDMLYGDDGDDVILGGEGADSLKGGKGADKLYGGEDSDDINGNDGDDTSYGNEGYDSCRGGNGTDTCNAEDAKECESGSRHKIQRKGFFHHFFNWH